jgi:anoctamin-10
LLALYQTLAVRFTNWENHALQSSHNASLTLKTFALSAIVSYLGLALSAFVYIPFGEVLMNLVQTYLFEGTSAVKNMTIIPGGLNSTLVQQTTNGKIWEVDRSTARSKINPSRLQEQMFAYTVTDQIVDTFLEVVFPFIQRGVNSLWGKKQSSEEKKHVAVEHEADGKGEGEEGEEDKAERQFLEEVRKEVALPEYTTFVDYSEMVTQFGYVAMWSTIWPLAPGEHPVVLDYGDDAMADDTRSHGPHQQCS